MVMERQKASGACDCGRIVYGPGEWCDECRALRKASREESANIWREDEEDGDE